MRSPQLESFFSAGDTPPIQPLFRLQLSAIDSLPALSWISGHSAVTYLALVTPLLVHLAIYRTAWGLRIRAVGDAPEAVVAAGLSVAGLRISAVTACGAIAALGGSTLSTAVLDRFEHHMPSGMGFMALAATIFGRWRPLGAFFAALFFAAANALRLGLSQADGSGPGGIPQGVWLALPYGLTLLFLALRREGAGTPRALGR
jgi:ABC-type uncharacterized transport system permease subunit